MKTTSNIIARLAVVAALVFTTTPAAAQSVAVSVNGTATPADDYWLASSVGWFFTPTSSFSLIGINTQFLATGGTDRNITVELLSAPRFNGGSLLASGSFNSSAARGVWGGATFGSAFDLVANTQYFVGFRNMAPIGAGNFDLVPESELLRVNFTDEPGAQSLGELRFDFDDMGQYELSDDLGAATQPMLQFIQLDVVSTVPEPSTVWLAAVALSGLLIAARQRKRHA